jgi:glycosyltransferase involved in cell wall biosynthesis
LTGEDNTENLQFIRTLVESGLSWFTPPVNDASGLTWQSSGFTDVASQLIRELNGMLIPVYYNSPKLKYHINFSPPEYFQYNNEVTVGYSPWEFTRLPDRKVHNLNACDEVWATSDFVKEVYLNNGVEKNIEVLPHGLSPDWEMRDREITDNFYFLLDNGGDLFLKVIYETIVSFMEADLPKEAVLVVKTTKELPNKIIDNRIKYIDSFLSIEDYRKLFYKCHVMVYPSNGEGFGLVPFQAVGTGMPTITTHLTGCADYKDHTILWPHNWEEAEPVLQDGSLLYDEDLGEWISPDFNHLPDIMVDVFNNYHEYKLDAIHSGKILRSSASWSRIADRMISLLRRD